MVSVSGHPGYSATRLTWTSSLSTYFWLKKRCVWHHTVLCLLHKTNAPVNSISYGALPRRECAPSCTCSTVSVCSDYTWLSESSTSSCKLLPRPSKHGVRPLSDILTQSILHSRIAKLENGMCEIGMKSAAMIPLLAFDTVANIYLTILFLVPLRSKFCTMPLYQSRCADD